MNELLEKYHLLSSKEKKQVSDFVDFILSKSKKKQSFDLAVWKEKILDISVWSEDDISVFEENRKLFDKWETPKW